MTALLRIDLLGEFHLEYHGALVTTLGSGRLQALLAYLVLHRHTPQLRAHVATVLWPDSG
jgi:DNA-binding SARP family transcriptional activator